MLNVPGMNCGGTLSKVKSSFFDSSLVGNVDADEILPGARRARREYCLAAGVRYSGGYRPYEASLYPEDQPLLHF